MWSLLHVLHMFLSDMVYHWLIHFDQNNCLHLLVDMSLHLVYWMLFLQDKRYLPTYHCLDTQNHVHMVYMMLVQGYPDMFLYYMQIVLVIL
jgi:hypothetical protein